MSGSTRTFWPYAAVSASHPLGRGVNCTFIQYIAYDPMDTPDPLEWRQRCACRPRRKWPSIPLDDLEETAGQRQDDPGQQRLPPERAASEWLRRGARAGE